MAESCWAGVPWQTSLRRERRARRTREVRSFADDGVRQIRQRAARILTTEHVKRHIERGDEFSARVRNIRRQADPGAETIVSGNGRRVEMSLRQNLNRDLAGRGRGRLSRAVAAAAINPAGEGK